MRTFKNQAAQGDTLFTRVKSIPKDATPVKSKRQVVVAHSETGHHHVFRAVDNVELFRTNDPNVCYLKLAADAELEHLRDYDTHEPILFKGPGCYEVRRQVESTPEGWRQVQD